MNFNRIFSIFPIILAGLSSYACFSRTAIPYKQEILPISLEKPKNGLRMEVFLTGRMFVDAWAAYIGGKGKLLMDQPAYLITHPTYGQIAFEAGHHSEIATSPSEHLGWIYKFGLMPMEQDIGQDFRQQLINKGKDPNQIKDIIISHFHPEHVGAVEEFPKARIVADKKEIEHGKKAPNYNYVPSEYDQVPNWYPIQFSGSQQFAPFEGVYDLVGDGSILVLSTPGHTPGHISLLVNLESGPILLTGDMAWTEFNLQTASIGLPFISSDGEKARVSLGKLLKFQKVNPDVLIVPGHDLNPLRRIDRKGVILHPWTSQIVR
ncbi:MAG: N-acyl homoserine lactonase family protein [Leptospira sp.]|nr:N-acyl homoserine lactonase family protein [Leptospira sp.]